MIKFNHDFSSRFRLLKGGKISLVVSALLGSTVISFAAPSGGTVTTGTATISQSGNVTNINQSTQKASINWQNFSIAANETVNFNQPNVNSITLNRVIGNEKSVIDGALNANGQVWILNSNGILFNSTAKVNTAGILATTAQLSDADFQAGNYNFKNANSNSVVNLGTIEVAENGYVVLASNEVRNAGTIKAVKGKVHLTGASEYTVNLNGNSIVNLVVTKGVLDAMVENSGTVIANGGEIYLTTNAVNELLKGVVNNSGILEANSLDDITGKVEVYAHGGTANVSGTIEAVGGFVETSGKDLGVAEGTVIKAKSWLIDPVNITIASGGTGAVDGTDAELTISANTIQTALASADVSLQADNNININEALSLTSNKTLTLEAGNDINFNAGVTVTQGMFNASAGNDINIDGAFAVSDALNFMADNNLNLKKSLTTSSMGYVYLSAKKDVTIDDVVTLRDNSEVYIESKNTIINNTITVDDTAKLNLSYGWIGTGWTAEAYGHDGKITFGMNEAKTDFAGKINLSETAIIDINKVTQTIIRTAAELQAMGAPETLSDNFVLAADIDLNGVTWTPIGERNNDTDRFDYDFKGSFNGLGHTISNLTINGNFEQSRYDISPAVGLFGNIAGGANISGVKLSNASVTNTNNADAGDRWAAPTAALVGEARAEYDADNDDEFVAAPTIHNNIVTGSTINSTGTGSSVGAIVGSAKGATISGNAVTTTTLSSANGYSVGGIVGAIYSKDEHRSTVTNSYVSGSTIKSAYGEVGGIVGYMEGVIVDNAMVKNSSIYTTGTIQGSYGAGGIVGDSEAYDGDDYIDSEIKNSSVESSTIAAMQDAGGIVGYMDDTKITNSFYDLSNTKIGDKTGVDVATNVAGVITYGGVDNAEFTAWLTGNKATLSAASLLGAAVGGYYSIDNVSDFRIMLALAYDPANKFKLGANITLDAGLYLPVLRGELDGNNKTISALNVSQSYNSYIGLVGRLEGGTVKNLTLNSPTLNGYSYVGGIAGKASQNYEGTLSPTISNVVVNGFNYSHTKEFNVASQHIDVSINNIGAIAGDFQDGTLSNLSASGNIAVDLTANNDGFNSVYAEYIGGLVGSTYRSTLDTASSAVAINVDLEAKAHSNSQAWDDNKVGAYNIGGLIGSAENSNLIKDTTTTGAISIKTTREITASEEDRDGLSDLSSIGGAFGYIGESYIKNATATNTITIEANNGGNYGDSGIREIGGIAGYTYGSFYDTATTSGAITLKLNDKAWGIEKVGGATGYAEQSILKDVDSTRNITTIGYTTEKAFSIGGLVGYADSTNIISSSYEGMIDLSTLAGVDAEHSTYESGDIGGLVGYNAGDTNNLEFASFEKDIAADVTVQDKTTAKTTALTAYNLREDVIALKALGYTLEDQSDSAPAEGVEYQIEFSIESPEMQLGVIKDSTAKVNIKAPTANNVGGLVGQMDTEDGGEIINSSVIALNDTSKIEGYSNVGGLVGSNSYGNITDSHATINVKANSTEDANVGGLVGYNEGGSSSEYLEEEFISESYVSEEAAQNAVNDVRDAFIAAQLEANPGYELDYSNAGVWNYNNIPNTIVVEVILAKSIPTGAISNSYATGTVTSVGGNTGGLVGSAYETIISDSYATGAVKGTMRVGGLVGTMEEDSIIETSYSTGTVNGADAVGGLVGYATGSEIVDSYHTTGKVTGSGGTEGITGGLVGILYNNNSISGSYATSEVEGEAGVGGLIGSVYLSSVENSYATGKVTASGLDFEGVTSAYAGGLAGGFAFSSLTKSYATGEVIANGVVAGGLLGNSFRNESIEESYATGKVTGTSQVGGLIGEESGSTISNVYSSGEVVASGDSIGSLMGQADGTTLTNSYASGKITLTGEEQINVKGLIGNKDATVANSFYDKTVNAGMADEATYGKSTTELKTLATYTTDLEDAAWDMGGANGNYPTLDFVENRTNIWMMGEGNTGGGSSPVDPTPVKPTPVKPTPEPEKEIEKVITTIVNNQQINVVLPVISAPVMSFAAPQPIVLNNNLALKLGIAEGASVSLVSAPQSGQESQRVSLNEISSGETRIALGGGSIIELVNSGVSLPEGVDQEFYVVRNDATDTSNNQNSKNNKNNKNKGAN